MSDIVIFKNMPNDDDYNKWIEENPNGFVLNIDQTKDPSKIYKDYPKIHFANCGQLNKRPGAQLKNISKFAQTQSKNLNNGAGSNIKKD